MGHSRMSWIFPCLNPCKIFGAPSTPLKTSSLVSGMSNILRFFVSRWVTSMIMCVNADIEIASVSNVRYWLKGQNCKGLYRSRSVTSRVCLVSRPQQQSSCASDIWRALLIWSVLQKVLRYRRLSLHAASCLWELVWHQPLVMLLRLWISGSAPRWIWVSAINVYVVWEVLGFNEFWIERSNIGRWMTYSSIWNPRVDPSFSIPSMLSCLLWSSLPDCQKWEIRYTLVISHSPGICISESSIPDIFENDFACIDDT